jgi:serine/threonine-protein kinase
VHALRYHRGVPFIVMERVFGVSLRSVLDERRATKKKQALLESLDLLISLADGLSAVHRAGISHRDVKPSNIMLAPGDRVVIMDFGLVLPEYLAEGEMGLAGTPGYIAPEVLRGTSQPGQGHLVDLYALGIIAYEVIVGTPPFGDVSTLPRMLEHLDKGVPSLTEAALDVPPELCDLVDSLRAHDPNERTQSAELATWQLRALRRKVQSGREAPLRILILDDDADLTALLRMKLRREFPNAEVSAVATGQLAIDAVRHRAPDVMLVDLGLPDMNGIEFCMYLRGTGIAEHTLMMAISGNVRDEDREVLALLGVQRFLGKGAKMADEIAKLIREFRPS